MRFIPSLLLLLLLCACQAPTVVLDRTAEQQSLIPRQTSVEPVQVSPHVPLAAAEDQTPSICYQLPPATELPPPLAAYLDGCGPLAYSGDFPLAEHARVAQLVSRYTGSQRKTFARWLERAGRYIPKIQLIFADEGLPLDLAYLAMIESGFNMKAYSWAHAAGPWQFIEGTGKIYGLENDWWRDERLDLEKSTRAAARHLKSLYKRFDGDWYLAVAAYNAGGGKVSRAIKAADSRDFWTLTEGKVLREETKNYLPKLLAALTIVRDLEGHGFTDLEFDEPLDYEVVTLESSTDLEIVAGFAGVDYQRLKDLNPELKRWCTPPGVKNYQLRVPLGSALEIASRYAELPREERASYQRHEIKAGDTLQALAKTYHIRVDDIIALNNISNPRALRIGTNLILPLKEGYSRLPVSELADSYMRSRRQVYTVRNGDSLWSIGRRFGVSEHQLRVWNKLGWSNLLRPGQVLAVSAPKSVARTTAKKKPTVTRKMVYKVLPGDTLWGIGRQFDVATEEIRRWNDLSQGHILRPGQTLQLMVADNRQG